MGFPMPPILCVPPKSVRACACARGTVRKSANACSTSFPGTSASVFRAGIRLSRNFFPNPSPPAPNRLSRSGGRGALRASSGGPDDGVDVLARYAGSDPRTCPPDLCVADLPLSSLSPAVLEQWIELYGVSLAPGVPQRTALRPARAIRQGELYAQLQPFGDARDHRTRTAGSHTSCARWRDSSRGRIPSRRGGPARCPCSGTIPICSKPGEAWAS